MSDLNVCRQCDATDGQLVACSCCEKMVLHEELCHHDYEGVFCQECDEYIDEENEEEEPASDEDEAWLKEVEEANNRSISARRCSYTRHSFGRNRNRKDLGGKYGIAAFVDTNRRFCRN